MHHVYENAYLTLGATASTNGEQGLLNRDKVHKFGYTYKDQQLNLIVRQHISHPFRTFDWVDRGKSELTLRKRAWCLQEELLSPRFIHFTRDELVFNCRKKTSCECTPDWTERYQSLGLQHNTLNLQAWRHLVQEYMTRQISIHHDRLPAISSLTQWYAHDAGQYLASLWASDLPRSLMWYYQSSVRSTIMVLGLSQGHRLALGAALQHDDSVRL
jgi:hypothetical protein